jgi:hypothetical protein
VSLEAKLEMPKPPDCVTFHPTDPTKAFVAMYSLDDPET